MYAGKRLLNLGILTQRKSVSKKKDLKLGNIAVWHSDKFIVVPHLQRNGHDNGEGHCLEGRDEGQLETTHRVPWLSQEQQQTETSSHQTDQNHKTQSPP